MSEDILRRVIKAIAETQRVPEESIGADATFEQLGIDSLDGIQIAFAIENEFNINVPDDAIRTIRSVRDLAEGVEKLIGPS